MNDIFNLANNNIASHSISHAIQEFRSYDEFLNIIYELLDTVCKRIMQSSKKISILNQSNKLNDICSRINNEKDKIDLNKIFYTFLEDDISIRIVDLLNASEPRLKATHDTYHNGHVDIHIIDKNENYTWLGEAKIYSGTEYIWDGLKQLLDYSIESKNESGGILIYIDNSKKTLTTKRILNEWQETLRSKNELKELHIDERKNSQTSFITQHIHHRTGYFYTIKHLVVDLRFTEPGKP